MTIEELMNEPRTDGTLLVHFYQRCTTEAFQDWLDSKMPGFKVQEVLIQAEPFHIALVVKGDGNAA